MLIYKVGIFIVTITIKQTRFMMKGIKLTVLIMLVAFTMQAQTFPKDTIDT